MTKSQFLVTPWPKLVTKAPEFFWKISISDSELKYDKGFKQLSMHLKHAINVILTKKITNIEAKHTKDSKDLACSTLSLWHLSRAFVSKKPTLGAGLFFYWRKVKIGENWGFGKIVLKKKIWKFFLSKLVTPWPKLVTPWPKIDFGHERARPPRIPVKFRALELL